MTTKVEVAGYVITIEETDEVISVKAEKDEEIVEEFTLELEGGEEGEESQDEEDVKGFDEFGDEEEDFEEGEEEGEELEEEGEELEEEGEELEEEGEELEKESLKLESFQSFINKKKK